MLINAICSLDKQSEQMQNHPKTFGFHNLSKSELMKCAEDLKIVLTSTESHDLDGFMLA